MSTYDVKIALTIVRTDGQPSLVDDHPQTEVVATYNNVPYETAFGIEKAIINGLVGLGEQGLSGCK